MDRYLRTLAVTGIAALVLVACGGGQAAQQPAASPSEAQVSIKDFAFDPAALTVPVGTSVTWTNNDSTAHTVTSDDGTWDSGRIDVGGTYSHVFDQAGTFTYHCGIHTSMTGTITVTQ